ncbi:MAG: tetratricopeptide repeat protein [Magnetococcales bacterium]|nr:tetratricopeptide repeat protein [Magnetococcales bacterium]
MNRSLLSTLFLAFFLLSGCSSTSKLKEKGLNATAFEEARKGLRHATLGEPTKAVEHFSNAAKSPNLSPSQRAKILNNRGVAHKNAKAYALAEADFTQALSLSEEGAARARHNRGIVRFIQGDYLGAARDLEKFLAAGKLPSPYPYLWLYIALERGGEEGKKLLSQERERLSQMAWPGVLADYLLTHKGEEDLLGASEVVDIEQSQENRCDLYFFLGEAALIAGNQLEAISWLNRAINTKMTHLNEFKAAEAELSRLAQ